MNKQDRFVHEMMPGLSRNAMSYAKRRGYDPEHTEEITQEVNAISWHNFSRTRRPLHCGNFWFVALRRIRYGRPFAGRSRPRDVLSPIVQFDNAYSVRSIDEIGDKCPCLADPRLDPAELAAFLIDFMAFFKLLTRIEQRVLIMRLEGWSVADIARKLELPYGSVRAALLRVRKVAYPIMISHDP